jgi:hypothetical protein
MVLDDLARCHRSSFSSDVVLKLWFTMEEAIWRGGIGPLNWLCSSSIELLLQL